MQLWQALLLGALQGVSELFPVSSLAQVILWPAILGWNIDYTGTHFLSFVVALHLATAIALFIFFWQQWRTVLLAYVGSIRHRKLVYDRDSKFAWLLVAGTVLAGLFGLIFEKPLRQFFENPSLFWLTAVLLIVNGVFMLYGEYLRRRAASLTPAPAVAAGEAGTLAHGSAYPQPQAAMAAMTTDDSSPMARPPATNTQHPTPNPQPPTPNTQDGSRRAEDLTFPQGAAIGATQILALIPGFSRSGITIVGGLFSGLSHEEAARFSFMLATPIIGLAALLKVPDLFQSDVRDQLPATIAAALVAGVVAYLSVRFLMRYFQTKRLDPFGYYCIVFGLFSLVVLLVRQ
jgi:undecaprenyl-diphosphatase